MKNKLPGFWGRNGGQVSPDADIELKLMGP